MFQTLFKYPRVLAHHLEGPAANERQRFLIHRAKEGATRGTLLGIARELLVIAKHIDVATEKAISIDDLEAAASRWVRHQQRRQRALPIGIPLCGVELALPPTMPRDYQPGAT